MNKRVGGGHRQSYRMVDFTRLAESETQPSEEKVTAICYDPLRSASLALVAKGTKKRWILAGEAMKVGDVIRSYDALPPVPGGWNSITVSVMNCGHNENALKIERRVNFH